MRPFVTNIILFLLFHAAVFAQTPKAEWTEGAADSSGRALHTLVLHNVTKGSRVWLQELFDGKTYLEGPAMHHYQGTSWYIDIPKSGKVTLKYFGRPLPRHGWAPEGFVLQQKGKPDQPMKVKYHFLKQEDTDVVSNRYTPSGDGINFGEIIPRVKRMHFGTEPMEDSGERPAGWYRIRIMDYDDVWVESEDEDGEFYAKMTLGKLREPLIPFTIEDWPDMSYRGFMLDVARDFRTVDEVLAILDLMAEWKLNTLHFHIADDESWCLEINGLPELTEYGAHHELPDWNLQETAALKPTCNGRIGYSTYYTAEEYQRILRYAWERRIRVVPEFDTPGHSRASIKAMQAYERRTGDATYRLQDPTDTSHYWSAQDFTDNVLSVYLPSVYTFYGKVFDEVIRLHREAGVPLPAIHIVGVEAALWSSQLRSFSDATYQMLPKGLGTAERAWNAYPNWPSEADFNADFERFYGIIMAIESARWEEKGYKSAMRR